MSSYKWLVVCCSVLGVIYHTSALNVLISPVNLGSHTLVFGRIAEELIKRGHNVTFVVASTMPLSSSLKKLNMEILTFEYDRIPFFQSDTHSKMIMDSAMTQDKYGVYKIFAAEAENEVKECHALLRDDQLYNKLVKKKFDISVVDILPCMDVLPYKLGIPFTHTGVMCPSFYFRQPDLPSFVPRTFHDIDFTDNMSFKERLTNTFNYLMEIVFLSYMEGGDFVDMYVHSKPHIAMDKLMLRASFCFCTKLPILDYPQPSMPTMAFVELMARPAQPITDKSLSEFLDSAKHGVVVCSFGTLVSHMPQSATDKLLEAFGKVKQHVVWRFPGESPANVPANVRLMKWLPQNDILGRSNTKLLIMHGGFSSLVEAVYHGIPMIVMPLFADQKYVAKVVSYKHYGMRENIATFTPDSLAELIKNVIQDASHKSNMTKASKIFQNQLNPAGDVIDFWLNHIVKFGDSHLRSHALEMPLYEYYMLDILALMLGIFIIFLCVIWYTCILLRGIICGKKTTLKTKQE